MRLVHEYGLGTFGRRQSGVANWAPPIGRCRLGAGHLGARHLGAWTIGHLDYRVLGCFFGLVFLQV